jgi:hypothetical protein
MPLHPNVRRCTHITVTGHRCGSPALNGEFFCYFHTRMIKGVPTSVDSQINPIALIENAEAIQAAIMRTIDSVLKGAIDNKRAALVLKALHIAVRNSRNVYFHLRPDDMVREVPNYAHQYLTEHPELNQESRRDIRPGCPPGQREGTHATGENTAGIAAPTPAAKRRKNAAHGASRGGKARDGQAPEERKKDCDILSEPPPLTNRETQCNHEIKKLEASVDGAMRGNWRDLRTVFDAAGLTPRRS